MATGAEKGEDDILIMCLRGMVSRGKNKAPESPQEEMVLEKEPLVDVFDGELKQRRYGIRIDDDLEILIIAGNELLTIEGRLLSMKDDLEIVDSEGRYQKIIMDWVVSIKILNHNRPAPDRDQELVKKPVRQKPRKTTVDHAYN